MPSSSLSVTKQYAIIILASVVSALLLALFLSHSDAYAATTYAPSITRTNMDNSGATTNGARFDLERTGTTNAESMTVFVYFATKPTSGTTITATDFKKGGTWDKGACFSGNFTTKCLYGNHTAGPYLGDDSGTITFSLPASGWQYDSAYNMYKQQIVATYSTANAPAATDNWAHFRLKLPSGSAGVIANGSDGKVINFADWNSTPATSSPAHKYIFRMATPCGITTNQSKNIVLGDLDSGSSNDNSGLTVVVTLYDETAGTSQTWSGASYAAMRNQGADFTITKTFQPGHKYRLEISNMVPKNIVRVTLPYSDANYSTACPWSITPSASITSAATVNKPGQTLTWSHTVTNDGPGKTDKTLTYQSQNQGYLGTAVTNTWTRAAGLADGSSASSNSTYVIQQSDVGQNLCRRTSVAPRSSSSGASLQSANACRMIPYSYDLVPTISGIPTAVSLGDVITYAPSINNTGSTKSEDAIWRVVTFKLSPAEAIPGGGTGSGAPESFFGHGAINIKSGTGIFNPGITALPTGTSTAPDLEVGSQVCFALSVQPYNATTTNWRYGAPSCAVMAKTPRLQVSGGDIMVGRGLAAPSPSATIDVGGRGMTAGKTYGSWAEYAAFAPSSSNIATGGALASNASRATGTSASGQAMTFANNNVGVACASGDGCFASSLGQRSDMYAGFSTVPAGFTNVAVAGGTINTANYASNSSVYIKKAGAVSVYGNVAQGTSVVIVSDGDITISDNIAYGSGTFVSLRDIPQVILIAKGDIIIANTVTQVDAWLYAGDTISTCDGPRSPYTNGLKATGVCDAGQLVINGPINAEHLQLRRTYGADSSQGGLEQTAEAVNLRSDAYLWATSQADKSKLITTVYTRELPARF